ncbi:uL15m family ribosomal protein [Candidatus Halobonum tyrrellensis]|uniref:Large ribosomal subunit protein uL15 n=1 Tax=Candidatus Halobonum tyrrellensis G22 TaxID=1324957 RepID=V4HLX2_9EURY|nr:uL15m family ribosomal protein [Candidatus Halobonum tyrrellensis]ESP88914.1 50S ribosomal protein L15P [Candidatus Halobonum tyrrellensis G22]
MTSKKRRQRGSRTHGGGSHKNRRGAGHRGGRGRAGRKKHERNLYGPLGKHGFKRPQGVKEDVVEVTVQKLDEDAALLAAEGVADEEGDGYSLDARDVAEDGHEADVVKVLGNGRVMGELHVTADAFTDDARELIEDAGGSVALSERGEARAERRAEEEEAEDTQSDEDEA